MIRLAGLGFGIYEEPQSKDSTAEKAENIAGQVGTFAAVEAAENVVPGVGQVLGAATAIGYGLYELFSPKKKAEYTPTPVAPPPKPVAPTMAFDAAPTLDSSAYRQPLGGLVN